MNNALFCLILLATGIATSVDARADDAPAPTTADASIPATTDAPTPAATDVQAPVTEGATAPAISDAPPSSADDSTSAAADAPTPADAPAPATAVAPAPVVADVPPTPPVDIVACDVELNVVDPDPKGLNVRAAPNAKKAKVIAVLKPIGDWVQVHVTGQNGDWLQIDHAEAIDDSAENGQRQVFKGHGWVHASKLGISELYVGDGTIVRDQPKQEGAVLLKIDNPDKEPKATKVLGCEAGYIKVSVDKQIGWTNSWCTNERTTCS